jgi:integrase
MLTDTAVRTAKARTKPYKLFDGGGMYLYVKPIERKPRVSKLWRLKYRHAGKEKLLALGAYPAIPLAGARKARERARELLAAGGDPGGAKREQKRQAKLAAADSFEAIAREWHEKHRDRWTPDHAGRVIESLEADAFPQLGHRPISQLEPQDVIATLRRVEHRGALDVSHRVLQRIAAVFRYAVHAGRLKTNPAADLRGVLKTRKVKHRPAMSRDALPGFLAKLDAYDGDPITKLGLRLLLLTFVRTKELRFATWDEFDLDAGEWRIPAARMKMRAPHFVPLSKQAVRALKELRQFSNGKGFVLPNRSDRTKPISENTMLYALYRMGYHSQATGHGFRATASTTLNEIGFRPDVIERQLAHAERNQVRAAYHRSEYIEERRKMMQTWADVLDTAAAGKVVTGRFGSKVA